MVKTIKISNDLNILLSIYKPACVRSLTPISEIKPVVKNINITNVNLINYVNKTIETVYNQFKHVALKIRGSHPWLTFLLLPGLWACNIVFGIPNNS